MQNIVNFFKNTLLKNPKFNSLLPVDDQSLLLPEFLTQVKLCIKEYQKTYPNQDITFTETYRSNTLQLKYYNNGASKLKKNGMHHYGIAVDCIFIVDGKRTYKGDITLIRKIFNAHGLTTLGLWDALHVQYIPVANQQKLRDLVRLELEITQ
jgi:hypothetical protein